MTRAPENDAFGRAISAEWHLDPDAVYLNHGTVGVAPRAVLEAQYEIRREIEVQPSRFLLRELTPMLGSGSGGKLRAAAESVAAFVGARGEDLVFVDNATAGVNSILRSLDLGEGGAVLITETTYGGVRQAVRYACRRAGSEVAVASLPSPVSSAEEVLAAVEQALSPGVRLAVLDHIVSESGVVLPVRELTALCHSRGVKVLIDGAHAPGQVPLDIPAIGADFYVANLHKWAFAPRSCGILWADPRWQADLHPLVVSWRLDEGFTAEFDWTGTRDPSAWLSAPAGLAYLADLGFADLRAYNHDLLWHGVEMLSRSWGTLPVAPEEMSAFMTSLPLPAGFDATDAEAEALRDALLTKYQIEVPVFAATGRLWVRLSVQVYNKVEDFVRLAEAIEEERPG